MAEFIARNVQEFNGSREATPHSYDRLDKLLDAQVYRLAHWKAAGDEINYRRFFDVNDLVAVCMEDPQVFQESHRLVFDLLVRGDVDEPCASTTSTASTIPWNTCGGCNGAMCGPWAGGSTNIKCSSRNTGRCDSQEVPLSRRGRGRVEISGTAPEWSQVEPAFLEAASAQGGDFSPAPATEAAAANDRAAGPNAPPPGRAGGDAYGTLRRGAAAAGRGRRKDPRPRGALARTLARGRHHRLRLPQSVNGLFVDPAGLRNWTRSTAASPTRGSTSAKSPIRRSN